MLIRPKSPANATAHHALRCHPASPCAAVSAIEAGAGFTEAGALMLDYRVAGNPVDLRIPEPTPPCPADGLWQHTCLEAFVAAVDAEEYHEFNFSPSGQWASYRFFTACRERDTTTSPPAAPQIICTRRSDGFQLTAMLAPELLPADSALAIGLTAVIEAADGSKSCWALAHCAAQPDFHLRQSFALTLHRTAP